MVNAYKRAKELKENATVAEMSLRKQLRINRIDLYFQYVQFYDKGYFILDFADVNRKIDFEIDGGYHLTEAQKEKDSYRDKILKNMGYTTIRFTNDEVFDGTAIREIRRMYK